MSDQDLEVPLAARARLSESDAGPQAGGDRVRFWCCISSSYG